VRDDPPVPPRLPCTAHRLASILQHPKYQVLGADLTMPERARLLAGQLQGALGEERRATQRRPHHPPAPPPTPAGHPPGRLRDRPEAIRLLGVATNRVKVDAEGVEQLGVAGPGSGHHAPPCQPEQLGPGHHQLHPVGPQHLGGATVALGDHAQQDMLRPEVAVAEPLSLLPRKVQQQMGLLGEPLEHLATSEAAAYGTASRSPASNAARSSSRSTPNAASNGPAAPW
jgi:hypothetical protein